MAGANIGLVEKNGIRILTFTQADRLNILTGEMLEELDAVLSDTINSKEVKGLIITGDGRAFSAGADLKRLQDCDAVQGYEFARRGQEIFSRLENLTKPSIAAINGFCFGGGCELAMAATLRVAASDASFAQPEVKLGVIPGYGGTQRLARLVGEGRALDLCLTGRFIDAAEAKEWGLVNQVVERAELLITAVELMGLILAQGPLAVSKVIQTIKQGNQLPLAAGLEMEALQFGLSCGSEDKAEGIRAFLQKRKPKFTGR